VILHVEFRADAARWRIRVAETGFTRDEPNRMAYNARGEVVSMGDPALDISTDQVRVAPIYDPSSFDPIGTARCVRFYTSLAHQEVRRGLAHLLDLFDRFDLSLELPGYSEIAPGLREKFERHLNALTFVRSYSINGSKNKRR
jgi:hypothetical protein